MIIIHYLVPAYRMLLSFKTSVTIQRKLTSQWTIVPVVKQLLSDITRFSAADCQTAMLQHMH